MPARTAARRKSRERIGADDARVWARELRLKNPFAKSIMLALANYMNEDGSCFPGIGTIARDTDISEDVVAKRLRWLEEIGAIAVFRCWRDDSGRRNYEGRGKPTSSEIRFLFDADRDEIEARAEDAVGDRPLRGAARRSAERSTEEADEEQPEPCETSEVSTRHGRGIQHPVSTLPAPEQHPPRAASYIDSELEQESQPQTPSQSEGALTPPIEDFQEAYPIAVSDLDKARSIWSAMTEPERRDAITGAAGYAALCRSQPRRTVEDAHRWLKNRKWQGYLVAGKAAEVIAKQATVPEGSPQGLIWKAIYDIATRGQGIPYFMIGGPPAARIVTVPTAMPDALIALDSNRTTWFDVTEDGEDHRFHAWRRWLIENVPNVKINYGPLGEAKRLRVPFDWPPRKDGTIAH